MRELWDFKTRCREFSWFIIEAEIEGVTNWRRCHNRAATKCVASKESVTAVENTLDDIGLLSTCSLQLEKDNNAKKIEDENILLNDLKSYVKGGTYAP